MDNSRTRVVIPALLAAMLLVSCEPPKFTEPHDDDTLAYFDRSDIKGMTDRRECVNLRFYTALRERSDTVLTAVVIPVDADGQEIYHAFLGPKYLRYMYVRGDGVKVDKLSRSEARTSVRLVGEGDGHMCAAEFRKDDVLAALAAKGANGIYVGHATTVGGEPSFEIGPVVLVDDVARPVGTSTHVYLCPQPCPSLCPTEPYLHR